MNREKNLIKNTLILAVGTLIPKASGFIVMPILTGYLTKAEYGTYDLISVICSLCLPAVTLQIQTSAFRYLIEFKENKQKQTAVITNVTAFLIPISFAALLVMFFVLNRYSLGTRLIICGYFLFDVCYSATGQISRGLLKSKVYASASVMNSLASLLCAIVFVYCLKLGLAGALICLFASVGCPTVYTVWKLRLLQYIRLSAFDRSLLKKQLDYSWPMVPNALSMWVMNASDRLVITLFMGIEANAVYAVAKKIPNIMTLAQNTFTMAWQESASLASDDQDSAEYYSKMFDIVFCMMAGAMMVILACMPLLFHLLIRGSYEDAYYQMPILIMGMFFFSLAAYFGGIYTAEKATKSVGITTLCAAGINLITNLLMIRFIGIYAASISTLISYLFLAVFRMKNIRNYVPIRYNYRKMLLILVVLTVSCILGYQKSAVFYLITFLYAAVAAIAINRRILVSVFRTLKKRIEGKTS